MKTWIAINVLLVLFVTSTLVYARTWKTKTYTIEGEFVELVEDGTKVCIKRPDGKLVRISLDRLSKEDQKYATNTKERKKERLEQQKKEQKARKEQRAKEKRERLEQQKKEQKAREEQRAKEEEEARKLAEITPTLNKLKEKYYPNLSIEEILNIHSLSIGRNLTDEDLLEFSVLPNLYRVEIEKSQISDAGFEFIKNSQKLEWLEIVDCPNITDKGIKCIPSGAPLRHLCLKGTQVSDKGLVHISTFTSLESLDLSFCRITNQGVYNLRTLFQLMILKLSHTQISDEALRIIAASQYASELKELNLAYTNISGSGLHSLALCTRLFSLDLSHCRQLNDEGMENLKYLVLLGSLSLNNCNQITNAGLVNLLNYQRIKILDLSNCPQITNRAIMILRQALPNCVIMGGN